jgi:iron-hydrogenase subunit gamma
MNPILNDFKNPGRDSLIPILQKEQERSGYLSKSAMIAIAKHLNLPPGKVFGVASFYNQFKFEAPGKCHIQICRGTACHVKGSANIMETIERDIGIKAGQTRRDGLFSLEVVACVGACSLAPVIIENGKFHANLDNKKLETLLKNLNKEVSNDK